MKRNFTKMTHLTPLARVPLKFSYVSVIFRNWRRMIICCDKDNAINDTMKVRIIYLAECNKIFYVCVF